ncbi:MULTISPECIES: hypothetical protein [Cryobacterium]|nr:MULTISPECIES: hypothetical protein [Cryobacterium]
MMNSSMNDQLWVGDLADFAAILGEPVSAKSRATLTAGGAVATYPQYVVALTAIIALVTASITIGLARADGHRDNAVLTSLGASALVALVREVRTCLNQCQLLKHVPRSAMARWRVGTATAGGRLSPSGAARV